MKYCQVCLRGIKGIFTWEFEGECGIGDRVFVPFRKGKRVGIIIGISAVKPEFKTQPILEIWDREFLSKTYIMLAQNIADENFSEVGKVLSLMIPETFWKKQDCVVRDIFYRINEAVEIPAKIGAKQKLVIDMIQNSLGKVLEKDLREVVSLLTIKSLLAKELIIQEIGKITLPKNHSKLVREKNHALNEDQQKVVKSITESRKPTLLFGVTGSGKTEVYKYLSETLSNNDPTAQTLLLVPEIALTSQLIAEFRNIFGRNIAIWHSELAAGEKIQEWGRVVSGEAKILVGARSSILVPMKNPKLIVLDEEHEWTYKNEFAPRFWTHDIAEKIATMFRSKLVFGSATPRVESFEKVETEKWNRADLPKRVSETKMPLIELVDLRNEAKKGNYSPISEGLERELRITLERGKQAVIFLNKRGFSGATMCKSCGHNFHCPNCSMSMKVHRKFKHDYMHVDQGKLICHACGHMELIKPACPECSMKNFEFRGWGTQMVEEELQKKFPNANILRADRDTITKRHDFEKTMSLFHDKKAQILLGTQMIAKGLDFEDVEFCGIILADVGLHLPDFRAEERVFQLLMQVSGRAGRRERQGKILIQTYDPDAKIYEYVRNYKIEEFIKWQKENRKAMDVPPFKHIVKFTFSNWDKTKAFVDTKNFEKQCLALKDKFEIEVNFAPAFFPRMHNKFHFHIFLKVANDKVDTVLAQLDIPETAKIDKHPISML